MVDGEALHPYVEFLFEADPILASTKGDERGNCRLGDITPEAFAEQDRRRRGMLAAAEAQAPAATGTVDWLEQQVLLTELRTTVRRAELERVWQRAPYWYTERLGEALSVLMAGGTEADAMALAARLGAVPEYCAQAQRNISPDAPRLWVEMGVSGARGLERFLAHAVPLFARDVPEALAADINRAAGAAGAAVGAFAGHLEGLVEQAEGAWACGTEQVDFLLRTYHHLDLDAAGLAEHGRELVERERRQLERLAATRDRDTGWQEQIDRIKDWHPQPPDFLATYGAAMQRALEHTRERDLIGIPDGAVCEMEWVPEYRRDGLPLGVMSPSPPYGSGLRSGFLITPGDPAADDERRLQHMRDNCYVFATSIAGHETFPGHHVQYVHHKLGTPRGSIRRYFSTPQFVEGWGLYVEDLLEETGFMTDDRVRLFKQRNALWRALRIVVDTGLHAGAMSIAEATDLMRREAGMDPHMAAGEVRRYARHDNPTYPSSYALGKDLIHQVRARHEQRRGNAFTLRGFHDWLLSFGTPPVALLGVFEL
ncbi:DUF885 domain-containing protein [Micromonospora sp. CB01531]|uniref:DUF885 domain-containing protein n=1 Tax=Micromonospora sp. CB01531 TaxID=1718947 RepID=UPI0009394ED4|nr:DUF885 domain-containing protein [Micromonospora sp. CB01531]OKI63390.1 hypothetical protein A6A27_26575 [Micromonospora sp. CB01531]